MRKIASGALDNRKVVERHDHSPPTMTPAMNRSGRPEVGATPRDRRVV